MYDLYADNDRDDGYLIDFAGDEWYTPGMRGGVAVPMPQASEVRLFDAGGDVVAVATYTDDGYSCGDDGPPWRTWRDAIEHAVRDHPDRDLIIDYINREF